MYIDHQLLYVNTRVDGFLLLRIDDLLNKLAKARVSSKIDLATAYY